MLEIRRDTVKSPWYNHAWRKNKSSFFIRGLLHDFLLGRSFTVVYGLYTDNYPLSEIENGDIFFWLTSKKIKGRTVIFLEGGMRNILKNCLQSLKRQNKLFANVIEKEKMFAEKSGKILKNIITKTEINIIT